MKIVCLSYLLRYLIQKQTRFFFLQSLYRDTQDPALKNWIRKLAGLAHLPFPLVLPHWMSSLKALMPVAGNARIDAGIGEFASYFERQWLSSQGQIALWNHSDDSDNLRTTNHAEDWHRSLSCRFQVQPRMPLGKFLVDFQQSLHHMNQVRDLIKARCRYFFPI